MDSETQDLKRRSEELRRGAETTLRKFGIVKADNEQDQQRIDALCEATFKRTARLSFQSRTPDDMQRLFGSINFKEDLPFVRRPIVRHYVSDPSLASVDPFSKTAHLQESTRMRFAADQEIYELFEQLHCELKKFEPRVIDTRPMSERLRSECFARVAVLSGRSEKEVERVYDRLSWKELPKDRNAKVERELAPELPNVPSFDPRRSASNQFEYEQQQRALREYELAMPAQRAAVREIVLRFSNLHGELNSLRTAELARASETKRLDQRIAQLQQVRATMEARS